MAARAASLVLCLLLGLASPAAAQETQPSLADVVAQVNPSVVTVLTVQKETGPDNNGSPRYSHGLGSGVIVSDSGLVLTAAHVVDMTSAVAVKLLDGQQLGAKVVSVVPYADLALVQLENPPANLTVAQLADSMQVRIGDQVFVLGAPFGIDHTLSVGHVSARHEKRFSNDDEQPVELIQTDAAINKGNSGGPMFDLHGRVVGVVSHILSQTGGFQGLGFAVSSNTAQNLLIKRNRVWLGFDFLVLDGALARAFNLPQEAGLLVQRVAPGSLGDKLGLHGGDLVLTIGNRQLLAGGDVVLSILGHDVTADPQELLHLRAQMVNLLPFGSVRMTVLRAGQRIRLDYSGSSQREDPPN